ncbi:MAG: hypothetical protein EZS28_052242 [Streblomastix strix]|uniref:Uncharacterized protein n=1 Tax=Streblomastix strix TaxID=222440 RepID=A0A5J4SGR0_9EUKA|nr:MAG: hypothetical protein EZS28_052242 [Streblomastix strix]
MLLLQVDLKLQSLEYLEVNYQSLQKDFKISIMKDQVLVYPRIIAVFHGMFVNNVMIVNNVRFVSGENQTIKQLKTTIMKIIKKTMKVKSIIKQIIKKVITVVVEVIIYKLKQEKSVIITTDQVIIKQYSSDIWIMIMSQNWVELEEEEELEYVVVVISDKYADLETKEVSSLFLSSQT